MMFLVFLWGASNCWCGFLPSELFSDLILTHFWMGILVFLSTNLNEEGMDPKLQILWICIYIMGIMCLRMEFAWREPLEKLIGSLWSVHDSLDLHDPLSVLQFRSVWQLFQFLVMVKIMTMLWLWRENGLMDEELWWDVCLPSANQTYLKSFHRLSQRSMIFYLPHVDGAGYAK
jgi:hypothetical protein